MRVGHTQLDWALLGIIAAVCAGLSYLQYGWTGEVSRAERDRLHTSLNEQLQRLGRAFDRDIRENCLALLPSASEFRDQGRQEAHRARYEQWAASHEPGVFSRLGVAVPERGALNLYGFSNDGQLIPMDWPAAWQDLQAAMTDRMKGTGRPPSVSPETLLLETPIFSSSTSTGGPEAEAEWMIFEISEAYARDKLLPRLVDEYLNTGSEPAYDIAVNWAGHAATGAIYSTLKDSAALAAKADAKTTMFPMRVGMLGGRGRRGKREEEEGRWSVAARHRAGSLDAAVSRARVRNLLTSFALIGLLGGTAWALVQFTARSRRLSAMQFRFVAGVSHDLRTPLTAIRGAAYNLLQGVVKDPAAVERYLKMILRNSEELTAMIENVLEFSAAINAPDSGKREPVAVGKLLEDAVAAMADDIEQAGCRVDLRIASGLPPISGDPVALSRAFRNLIANAARHGSSGKWIGISAECGDRGVDVRVEDHGPGIPDAERDRIFEPFYRGEQTRASHVRGTGLGLSLVKGTVERHGGAVTVQPAAGGGAQFQVRLPAIAEAA